MNHQFLMMWDCYGLEYLEDVTQIEADHVWAKLQDKLPTINLPSLNHLILRARANSQRNYEIYVVEADDSISKKDLAQQWKDNPQGMADLVRSHGHKLYSDRLEKDQRLVI